MSEIEISPVGAGTATSEVVGSETFTPGTEIYTGWRKWYKLTAFPNAGYEFSHWEITYRNNFNGEIETETETRTLNPSIGEPDWGYGNLCEYDIKYEGDYEWLGSYSRYIISIVAVFVPSVSYDVITLVNPVNAGRATGAGSYRRGESCTIEAIPKCSPWKFDHWEIVNASGRYTTKTNPYTLPVYEGRVCSAFFTHTDTGLPYFDADGNGEIICNQDGEILYDGDAV